MLQIKFGRPASPKQNKSFNTIQTQLHHMHFSTFYKNPSQTRKSHVGSPNVQKPQRNFKFASNQRQRVLEAVKRNQMADSTPSLLHQGYSYERIMNLRPREEKKELGGQFRYRYCNRKEGPKISQMKIKGSQPLFSTSNRQIHDEPSEEDFDEYQNKV